MDRGDECVIFDENKLQEMGAKIQSAMELIDTVVRFPQYLRDVVFIDDIPKSVFNENLKTITFRVTYVNAPEIKEARKNKIEEYEKELEAELAKIKAEKEVL
jgi:hypothetical protein